MIVDGKIVGTCLGLLRRLDRILYPLWAAAFTLASARSFYGYMLKQTGGEWSAPLDDVFIHFDYARSTALGHPFEWTVGNGYSSGNTSLTYPFVLAAGYLAGFTGRELMVWAAIVAAISVFGVLLAARPVFVQDATDGWGRTSSYLLPPVFFAIGALDWSLWSGMEVAFFLATWAIALVAWFEIDADASRNTSHDRIRAHALSLGLAGALIVTTRPEGAICIATFGIAAALAHRHNGRGLVFGVLSRAASPSGVVLLAQTLANKAYTGEFSANGAIVKLALNNPFMTAHDKYEDWLANAKYATLRNLEYHFASADGGGIADLVTTYTPAWPIADVAASNLTRHYEWAGIVPLVLATIPLAFASTRKIAIVFWIQIVAWIAVVALNGQVRWQNERYVMPAVAWMLVMSALGISIALRSARRASRSGTKPNLLVALVIGALLYQTYGVVTRAPGSPPVFRMSWIVAILCGGAMFAILRKRSVRGVFVVAAALFVYDHQASKMRDQRWFFGRASRNIRDQHLTLGKYLADLKPKRVLVGDAGAILYESDRPGLDIIGLGGYGTLPFARAGVQGLPATLELIEHIAPIDRPDVLAIFPTWWGILPVWFGSEVLQRFPVEGNVICGGYEHVVYRADWHLLGTGTAIRILPLEGSKVRTEIDVADLVSERASSYVFDRPENGWTEMRVLPDPKGGGDLFDAGRHILEKRYERFVARGLTANEPAHLVVRSAPEGPTTVRVRIDGVDVGSLHFERTGGWVEAPLALPVERVTEKMAIELFNEGPSDFVDYHVWLTQP